MIHFLSVIYSTKINLIGVAVELSLIKLYYQINKQFCGKSQCILIVTIRSEQIAPKIALLRLR